MSILAFQKPEKVAMEKLDNNKASFTFKPLERGYGVTIGNALRRILLSSLEGYAITSIKIPGVLHEFSTVEGVMEDVTEIILNLKMIRFRKISAEIHDKINVRVSKKNKFVAGDIMKFTSAYEVLNPKHIICNLDENVNFEIELTIEKGRGYISAEDNKESNEDNNIGIIYTDSIFTPIKNVKYSVENTRVEQKTDYEKLTLYVETDGSIDPKDALRSAAKVLMQHFVLCSDSEIELDNSAPKQIDDEEYLYMRKLLRVYIEDLGLSVRAYNCLRMSGIKTLGDLVRLDLADMMKFRNFGKKSLTEIEKLVKDKKLEFGMDVSKYKIDIE